MTGKRIFIDTSKCIACKACQVACKQWHSLPSEDTSFTGSYQNPPDMSGANLTVAKFTEIEDAGEVKWLFFKDGCRHCQSAPCQACPLRAVIKQADGIVRIDPAKCKPNSCSISSVKPCQTVCPYKVPKFKYVKNGAPIVTEMKKCDFCYNRFGNSNLNSKSRKPACAVTCPPGAILNGAADKMMTKAKSRVTYLKANGFPDANVYPKQNTVWGPTHVIWVLTRKPSVYGL
jgi:formate dehydrogenase iron-sulfur subunit